VRAGGALAALAALCASSLPASAGESRPGIRKPKDSWTIQVGLSHSEDGEDHYAVSGLQGRLALFALDRRDGSDRLGSLGLELGLYPYPMISRAYVPGPEADPHTPGK
jgi:hypothetical protein